MLERNEDNVWELLSDSREQPELLGDRIIFLLSELMKNRADFIGTPTELTAAIGTVCGESVSPKKVSRLVLQNVDALRKLGIEANVRRSNGKRLIELQPAESDGDREVPNIGTVCPCEPVCGGMPLRRGKCARPESRPDIGPFVARLCEGYFKRK